MNKIIFINLLIYLLFSHNDKWIDRIIAKNNFTTKQIDFHGFKIEPEGTNLNYIILRIKFLEKDNSLEIFEIVRGEDKENKILKIKSENIAKFKEALTVKKGKFGLFRAENVIGGKKNNIEIKTLITSKGNISFDLNLYNIEYMYIFEPNQFLKLNDFILNNY